MTLSLLSHGSLTYEATNNTTKAEETNIPEEPVIPTNEEEPLAPEEQDLMNRLDQEKEFLPGDFETRVSEDVATPPVTSDCSFELATLDETGEVMQSTCTTSVDEVTEYMKEADFAAFSMGEKAVLQANRVVETTYGIFYFDASNTSTTFNIYSEPRLASKIKTYVNPGSQNDALYLGTVYNSESTWFKIKISGVTGYIQSTRGTLVPVSQLKYQTLFGLDGPLVSRYYTYASGSEIRLGYQVVRGYNGQYMEFTGFTDRPANINGADEGPYYSYDGVYYYRSIEDMTVDTKAGTNSRAINAAKPYYDYYMYLPGRSISKFTASDFDTYLLKEKANAGDTVERCYNTSGQYLESCSGAAYRYVGPLSTMFGQGAGFIDHQNNYGVNSIMIYAKGILESGWGMSTLAYAKNNLFGVGAFDSSPFTSATQFPSIAEGIRSQFQNLMSSEFYQPTDWRYAGSHVGNKGSGVNVQYAADPNWGYKIAARYRLMDMRIGYKDLNTYQVAVTTNGQTKMYQAATGDSYHYIIGQSAATAANNRVYDGLNIPMIVIGEQGSRYLVIRDASTSGDGTFNFTNVGYVNKSDVRLSNQGKNGFYDPKVLIGGRDVITSTTPTPYQLITNSSIQLSSSSVTAVKDSYVIVIGYVKKESVTYAKVGVNLGTSGIYVEGLMKASDLKLATNAVIGTTQASSIRVRQDATSASSQVGMIDAIGTQVIILSTKAGQEVLGVSSWYEIALNATQNSKGYILAHPSWVSLSNNAVISVLPTDFIAPSGQTGIGMNALISNTWQDYVYNSTLAFDAGLQAMHAQAYGLAAGAVLKYAIYQGGWLEATNGGQAGNGTDVASGVRLSLEQVSGYDVSYRVLLSNGQWTNWVKNGATAGDLSQPIIKLEYKLEATSVEPGPPKPGPTEIQVATNEWIYLHQMTMTDGKLSLQGHFALSGVTQTVNTNITYQIEFLNRTTGESTYFGLDRWISDTPYNIGMYNGRDATGTWFRKNDVDISKLAAGDYQIYLVSKIDGSSQKAILNNIYLKFKQTKSLVGGKQFSLKTNYLDKKKAIELTVYNKILSNSIPPNNVNNLATFTNMSLNNATLSIRGYAFNVGVDYNKGANVARKLHFINISTQEIISYDLGSIDQGDYPIPLTVDDGMSRDRAWFEQKIFLEKIPKGTYKIVVESASGSFADDGELVYYFYNALPSSTYNNKTYRFIKNASIRQRIELVVE